MSRPKIRDIEVDYDPRDYPDFVDAYVTYATWDDTGLPLSDGELESLNEHEPEIAQELACLEACGG